jgi:subtilase family serine protease
VIAGLAFAVNESTANIGGGAAPGSMTRFCLSPNWIADAGDVLVGGRAVAPIVAGGTDAGSTSLTVPAGTAPGRYYLLVVADADGQVPEVYENNNGTWKQITVAPPW